MGDNAKAKRFLMLTRMLLGFEFLWAFFDKLLGLGFATKPAAAWVSGGSPTAYFLKNVTHGPFAGFFQSFSGQAWVDWMFMLGLLGIGLALISGFYVRFGAFCGATLLLLMWLSMLPPANNPIVDEHVVYAAFLAAIVADKSIAQKRWPWSKR